MSGVPDLAQPGIGEECDDGNLIGGDGCDSACLLEPLPTNICGNNVLEGTEQCDGTFGCASDCKLRAKSGTPDIVGVAQLWSAIGSCTGGESIRYSRNYVFDPNGDLRDSKIAKPLGTRTFTFFRVTPDIEGTWQVRTDVYGDINGYRRLCGTWFNGGYISECGDLVVEGDEQCDDGNKFNGDGCSAICQLE